MKNSKMAGLLQVSQRRTMKKDNSNNMDRNGSRASSPSSVTSSKASQRGKDKNKEKDKGPTREELTEANAELCREVEELNEENQKLKFTVSAVIDKLIENAKIKGVKPPKQVENPDVTSIPLDSLINFTEKVTAESRKSDTMEYRVEELETRITHLNMELAKLLRTRVHVENGLDYLLNDCDSLDEMKSKAQDLIRDMKGNGLFTFLESLPLEGVHEDTSLALSSPLPENQSTPRIVQSKPRTNVTVVLKNEPLNLTPPKKKYDASTSIKDMDKDLRQYIIQQLSLPKGNGADWRMMGERIGIPPETINQWKRNKVNQPMAYVFQYWISSPGATVRLLHRHLVSPQMRCTLLAKRISDFYCVD
ncbi:hypothetical protein ACF0H5_002040 [Mactra antiquata]